MNQERAAASDKDSLRRAMILELQNLHSDDRMARSEKICARVAESTAWQASRRVLLFAPLRTEPQIVPLEAGATATGKQTWVVPPALRIEADLQLPFVPDLVLVPGLAFSRDNYRLGRGSGFYDRLLAGRAASAYKLAVAFAFQLLDSIPIDAHDARVDAVFTD